jgi:hypothetical protein
MRAENEDRYTVVVAAVASTRGFEGASSGQHRPGLGIVSSKTSRSAPDRPSGCLPVAPGLVSVSFCVR